MKMMRNNWKIKIYKNKQEGAGENLKNVFMEEMLQTKIDMNIWKLTINRPANGVPDNGRLANKNESWSKY